MAPKLRASAAGHAVGGVLHLGAGVAALIVGQVMTAVWILVVAVPLHTYPVMLQLLQLHRMQRVLMASRARGTEV
ncbi:hypothetical protein FEF26_00050 [Nesterenkonia salmonea]|uniref:Glycosyl-4,4'-diaponeurosporenoate acyltransferase n=1 Tax=Nesterenkonia salmonea TaxID=1804987 RepID=A0A5R9BL33_9MICC|nr:hypothetical protein [Nesterenkonia salmonea]TLQ01416.1 hypothetical protein FEF26_00050 [Nesterenkonia salmonea]